MSDEPLAKRQRQIGGGKRRKDSPERGNRPGGPPPAVRDAEPTTPEETERLRSTHRRLLEALRVLDTAKFFHEPVPDIVEGYHEVIAHPMDFATIARNIEANPSGYTTHSAFIADVDRVFFNAVAFNKEGSSVLKAATVLQSAFDTMLVEEGIVEADNAAFLPVGAPDEDDEEDEDDGPNEDLTGLGNTLLEEATMPIEEVLKRMVAEGRARDAARKRLRRDADEESSEDEEEEGSSESGSESSSGEAFSDVVPRKEFDVEDEEDDDDDEDSDESENDEDE